MGKDSTDPFNLQRFVEAQAPLIDEVRAELRIGHKTSHWIWFVFPQIAGLGHSATARFYAIASRAEAIAYAKHPILGSRLIECVELVLKIQGRSAHDIFGSPDDMKFRSSLTLFAEAAPENGIFKDALQKYFRGEPDRLTLERL